MKEATKTNEIYGSTPRGTLGVRRSGLVSVVIIIIIFFFDFISVFFLLIARRTSRKGGTVRILIPLIQPPTRIEKCRTQC